MIVVDSSVWIARLRGQASRAVLFFSEIDDADVILGDIVLLEVLQGARDDRHAERLAELLSRFILMPMVGSEIALAAAAHFRFLRSKGVTVRKTADLIIATFCIEGGHMLLQQDRDFDLIAHHLDLRLL